MIIALLLLFFLLRTKDYITRYIYAVALWMLICFCMTEILSAFELLNTKMLWMSWLTVDVFLFILGLVRKQRWNTNCFISKLKKVSIKADLLIWCVFVFVMLGMAVKTVPYNWDSMTYHLPRLFHWGQNGSVDFYATGIDRQVSSPIGGAYVNVHVYLMTNYSDRFLNLLQCCSFLTNGVLVYHIAKKIGCSKRFCNLSALLFYSMPIAFAEAVTTQVDNFSALWMLAIVYLLIDLLGIEYRFEWNKGTLGRVLILSICVAFGYLTKPSIGIGLAFFAIWLLIMAIRRKDNCKLIVLYLAVASVVLGSLVTPNFIRNINTFDALSAPGVGQRQLVGTLNPREVLVNCAKNFTFNMPTIWIYDSSTILEEGVTVVADLLNVDIDNPAISEDGKEFGVHNAPEYGHDTAINPVVVWLLVLCVILWGTQNKKRQLAEMRNAYFIVASVSFVAFCALLRWEPFVSRYMISYLGVLCPAIAGQLEMFFVESKNEKQKSVGIRVIFLICFMCIAELFGLVYCHGRIALTESRFSGYFRNYEDIEEPYRKIVDIVNARKCENVGMLLGGDTFEYPLIVMLNDYKRLEHICVTNMTAKHENEEFIPDIIISIDRVLEQDVIEYQGAKYEMSELIDDNVYLLERKER